MSGAGYDQLLIDMGSRRRSASQAIGLPSDGGGQSCILIYSTAFSGGADNPPASLRRRGTKGGQDTVGLSNRQRDDHFPHWRRH
jgi:hypothetical protein